jgi:hypothetical protein
MLMKSLSNSTPRRLAMNAGVLMTIFKSKWPERVSHAPASVGKIRIGRARGVNSQAERRASNREP